MGKKNRSNLYVDDCNFQVYKAFASIKSFCFRFSDGGFVFVRITWCVCFVVGASVLYSTFRRTDDAFSKLFAGQENKFEFKGVHVLCSEKYLQDVSKYPGEYRILDTTYYQS